MIITDPSDNGNYHQQRRASEKMRITSMLHELTPGQD